MRKEEFKDRLKEIDLTQENFAKLFGIGYSTVKGWKITPIWVEYVLDYLELASYMNNIENAKLEVKKSFDKRKTLIEKVRKLDDNYKDGLRRKKSS
jgi:hypothetical protein